MSDRMIKCISQNGTIRGVAMVATDLVRELGRVHQLSPEGKKGLGEAVMSGLLLASSVKSGERINLKISGSGLYYSVLVEARPDGKVRGMLSERAPEKVDLTPDPGHEVTETGPWGHGALQVLKTREQEGGQPFVGTVPLATGHLAKDLTYYLMQSEQIPSAVGLTVHLDGQGEVQAAGAFLVQVMPGASDEDISMVEAQVQHFPSFEKNFARDPEPLRVLAQIFQDAGFTKLDELPLEQSCPCTRERVAGSIALFGKPEIEDILSKEGRVVIHCDFCKTEYAFEKPELEELLKKMN